MTFKEILDLTKSRIDETDEDSQIDLIIKNAINHSYLFDLSLKEQHVKIAYITPINGAATLPSDMLNILNITPALVYGESRVGNVILSKRDTDFTIIYSVVPKPLVADTDKPSISEKYHYSMSTYACYEYFNYRKKTASAQQFYTAYENELNKLDIEDNTGEETVYDSVGGETTESDV